MPTVNARECRLANDLGDLWERNRLTDCCVYVRGQEFHVHKAILAARSAVFNGIFQHQVEETIKYALDQLETMCERALCANLSVENALDMLILADRYRTERLRVSSINFISSHATDVMDTISFKLMTSYHPELVMDAFRTLATAQCPPRKRMKRLEHLEQHHGV
uniref:BTB domain-containing protein n=1 Tax=Eptatretus burgeri TaxID=7764 RepID=A0A8C4X0N3_EPTBU